MLDSLAYWHDYFVRNRSNLGSFDWDAPDALTNEEKRCIEKSVAAFQLGESSDGKGLIRAAERFAHRYNDERLVQTTRLFIAEEQNHARLLKRFMEMHGMELLAHDWSDTVFRRLRKNVGFASAVTVLITAEIISLVYYRALQRATDSLLLKKICEKILADEAAHVRYESEILKDIRRRKAAPVRALVTLLHQALFAGTTLVVYLSHRRVLNRGGYDFACFAAACWLEYADLFPTGAVVRAAGQARIKVEASSVVTDE